MSGFDAAAISCSGALYHLSWMKSSTEVSSKWRPSLTAFIKSLAASGGDVFEDVGLGKPLVSEPKSERESYLVQSQGAFQEGTVQWDTS